ncbi:hypothetical protein ACTXT7_012309 [Hymenolepis weldensis]
MTMPDNATPHTSRVTKNVVEERVWEVMHRPPYSPHLLLHKPIFNIFPGAYRIIEWDKGLLQGKRVQFELNNTLRFLPRFFFQHLCHSSEGICTLYLLLAKGRLPHEARHNPNISHNKQRQVGYQPSITVNKTKQQAYDSPKYYKNDASASPRHLKR